MDSLKSLGDEIANKGKPSLVQPFEKQIFKRWEDLEKKFEFKISDTENKIQQIKEREEREEEERLQNALKLIEEQKLQEKKVEVIEEEVILPESARSAESAPTMIEEVPVNIELVTQDESVGDKDSMWIMRRETESTNVKQYAEVKFMVTNKTVEKSKCCFFCTDVEYFPRLDIVAYLSGILDLVCALPLVSTYIIVI